MRAAGIPVLSAAILGVLMTAGPGRAQEERAIGHFAGSGVRAMGMGGAYLGVADDFSALYWNPAGLAQMDRGQVQMSFLRNALSNDATLGGERASADLTNTRFGSLGMAVPYPVHRGSLVLAAGFTRVKDFDWTLRTSGFLEADSLRADDSFTHEGAVTMASVAAALDVSPSVSLGLAVNLVTGEDESTNEFISTDTRDYFLERRFLDRETFVDDYESAITATFGVLMRLPREDPRVRVGATVATGATHLVRYTFRAPPADRFTLVEYDDGSTFEAGSETYRDSYRISLPLEFGVGASYEPLPGLLLAGSLHLAEWSQSEYEGRDDLRANAAFETQYRDVTRYHLGVEYQIPTIALDLRAGYYTDPLPFAGPRDPELLPDPVRNPIVDAVEDRSFWTAGFGLVIEEAVRLEVAWNRGSYERVEGVGTDGLREDTTISRIFGGLTYSF